ncbi:MAG: DUF169 domain-containing protein [Actinomycetota bacterium]|nr:DUF169 domain-containing protein [Actinomycetota bacterium]
MTSPTWQELGRRLTEALHLAVAPVAIAFGAEAPAALPAFDAPMSEPAPDGRRGRVPASCVFWIHGADHNFSTLPADHGNCSVGRYTHGLASLEDVAGNDDVAALLESGWVSPEAVGTIPAVSVRPGAISYGPLGDLAPGIEPDVVLLRVNGRQLMVLSDALAELTIQGKPQCHIVALAERGTPAASVGCALSRSRTGMRPEEMTCALPAARLAEAVEAIEQTAAVDSGVARYAASDARRF